MMIHTESNGSGFDSMNVHLPVSTNHLRLTAIQFLSEVLNTMCNVCTIVNQYGLKQCTPFELHGDYRELKWSWRC